MGPCLAHSSIRCTPWPPGVGSCLRTSRRSTLNGRGRSTQWRWPFSGDGRQRGTAREEIAGLRGRQCAAGGCWQPTCLPLGRCSPIRSGIAPAFACSPHRFRKRTARRSGRARSDGTCRSRSSGGHRPAVTTTNQRITTTNQRKSSDAVLGPESGSYQSDAPC